MLEASFGDKLIISGRSRQRPRDVLKEVEYTYDIDGRRIEVKADDDADGSLDDLIKTVCDGANAYADFDGLNSDALETRYLASQVADQLFACVDDNGGVNWLLTDRLGSVRQVVDTESNRDRQMPGNTGMTRFRDGSNSKVKNSPTVKIP